MKPEDGAADREDIGKSSWLGRRLRLFLVPGSWFLVGACSIEINHEGHSERMGCWLSG
jgi:hypothetical protein